MYGTVWHSNLMSPNIHIQYICTYNVASAAAVSGSVVRLRLRFFLKSGVLHPSRCETLHGGPHLLVNHRQSLYIYKRKQWGNFRKYVQWI